MSTKTFLRTTSTRGIRQGFVDSFGGQIHYWTAGHRDPLLLIHQSSASAEEYAGLVPFLKNHYRLIAFDWPGHGSSTDPLEEPGVVDFTNSAITVLDHLGIQKCHILGHHGGALVAMNLAYQYPDRIEKVILSGTSGLRTAEETSKFSDRLKGKGDVLDREGHSLLNAWHRYTGYLSEATIEQVLMTYINHIVRRLRPYDAHRKVLQWDRHPALSSLVGPVLLMQGEKDSFVSHQEHLLNILPDVKRVIINGGGPFMFYDKCKECAAVIDGFLKN